MEVDPVLAYDDVGHAVAVVSHWTEPAAGGNVSGGLADVDVLASDGRLGRGKTPGLTQGILRRMLFLTF